MPQAFKTRLDTNNNNNNNKKRPKNEIERE